MPQRMPVPCASGGNAGCPRNWRRFAVGLLGETMARSFLLRIAEMSRLTVIAGTMAFVLAGSLHARADDWREASRDDVERLQDDLRWISQQLGHGEIGVDGLLGPQTRRAVEQVSGHVGVDFSSMPFAEMSAGISAVKSGFDGWAWLEANVADSLPFDPGDAPAPSRDPAARAALAIGPIALDMPLEIAAARAYAELLGIDNDPPRSDSVYTRGDDTPPASYRRNVMVATPGGGQAFLLYRNADFSHRLVSAAEQVVRYEEAMPPLETLVVEFTGRHGPAALELETPVGDARLVWASRNVSKAELERCAELALAHADDDGARIGGLEPFAELRPLYPSPDLRGRSCGPIRIVELSLEGDGVSMSREIILDTDEVARVWIARLGPPDATSDTDEVAADLAAPPDPLAFERAACDLLPPFEMVERFWYNQAHQLAVRSFAPGIDPPGTRPVEIALEQLEAMIREAEARHGTSSATVAILRADWADIALRFAQGLPGERAREWRQQAFETLLETARTPAEADYLLHLARAGLGQSPSTGQPIELTSQARLEALERHFEIVGPDPRQVPAALGLLAMARGSAFTTGVSLDIRIALAERTQSSAMAGGTPRHVYEAQASLIELLMEDGRVDSARQVALELRPAAMARLSHTFDHIVAGGDLVSGIQRSCWAKPMLMRQLNDLLADLYTEEDAKESAFAEAIEAAIFATLETDYAYVSDTFASIAALSMLRDDQVRDVLSLLGVLNPFGHANLSSDTRMALHGAQVWNSMGGFELERYFLSLAEQWTQAEGIHPDARLLVLKRLIGHERSSGLASRVPGLTAEAEALIETAGTELSAGKLMNFKLMKASYLEAVLEDAAAVESLLEAIQIQDEAEAGIRHVADGDHVSDYAIRNLVESHLAGGFCSTCTDDLRPVLHKLHERDLASFAQGTSVSKPQEFAFRMVESGSPAVDDALRQSALDLLLQEEEIGDAFSTLEWEHIQSFLDDQFLTPVDRARLLVLARAFPGTAGAGIDALDILRMLIEQDDVTKPALLEPMLDADVLMAIEFGGVAPVFDGLDRYARLLELAGDTSTAQLILERLVKLSRERFELHSPIYEEWWSPPDEAGRLQLARILAPAHVRLAEHAFEDGDREGAIGHLEDGLDLVYRRLAQEWAIGREQAAILYREFRETISRAARLYLRLAMGPEGRRFAGPAFETMQLALLGETSLAMQAAVRNRILADEELRHAVEARDEARLRLGEIDALERLAPSRLPALMAARREEARTARDEATAVVESLLAVPEEFAALSPVGLEEAQAALDPTEGLLMLHVTPEAFHGLAMRSQGEPHAFVVTVEVEVLTDRVARLRREVSSFGAVDMQNAHHLHELLLGPAETVLEGIEHLIVVADGPLPALPWSALATEASPNRDEGEAGSAASLPGDGTAMVSGNWSERPWLIRRYPVSVAPGVASFVARRAADPGAAGTKPFLGIGDPVLSGYRTLGEIEVASLNTRGGELDFSALAELAPLPETAAELIELARAFGASTDALLLGPRATETELHGLELTDYRVIAFATHGLLAGEIRGAAEPGLVLTPEVGQLPGRDGYLTLSEIMTLRLDADLVILSACNTGGPDGRPRSEWMTGLARGFIAAGARQLLVTLWEIPSQPTVRLTTGMAEAHGEIDGWPAALRASILDMIDAPRDQIEAHPGSWAGFTMLGAGQ